MKVQIPTTAIVADYNAGSPTFPEAWFTINEMITRGRIIPQTPSFDNGNSLFQDGASVYEVNKESLNDIHQADGIIFLNPFVWEADVEIFDLPMPTTIPGYLIPTGGTAVFSNIYKFTTAGTSVKTVGEWMDSLCDIYRNDVLGKVQIYTDPINASFIEFHLVKAFEKEFEAASHASLTNDTDAIEVSKAVSNRALDPTNWIKQ